MIGIQNPQFLHEQGKRDYNQDNIYPAGGKATINSRLFLVCDGVGGSQRGDVASDLMCQYFPE